MSDEIPKVPGSVIKGIGVVIGCTIGAFFAAGFVGVVTGGIGAIVLLGIGVVQAAWIIPLWRYYRRLGESETAKGLLIMASIVFLLNAGCWGMVAQLNIH